jgi:AcrR family transcriptional regulator
MTARAPDRRVERTRNLLRGALMELIVEKGYEAVTVQDIIDRANVGRATFYAHFADKQQLLVSGFEELRVFLVQKQHAEASGPGPFRLRFSLAMFEHACGYRQVYRALVGKQSGAVVRQRMQQLLTELVQNELAALRLPDAAPSVSPEIVAQYVVSSFMGLLMWCVDHETPDTPEEMDAIFQRLTLPGVLAGLGWPTGLVKRGGRAA